MPPPTDATPKSFMLSAFATSRQLDHQATLRLMFAVHFALTCCVLLGTWPSITYTFYNTFLLVGLLWTLAVSANGCELPLTKCIFIETIAIVFDIFVMWSSYHVTMLNKRSGFVEGFALFMCIFQLLLRPVAVLLLLHIRTDILKANRYENVEDVTAMLGAGGHHHHHQISPPMAIPIVGMTTDNCGGWWSIGCIDLCGIFKFVRDGGTDDG